MKRDAGRLASAAAEAARVRAYQTDPDVVALRVERIRTQVDRLMWTGIVLGLGFTMANVQQFAARGAAVGSLPWAVAWVLDPMVSLVLLAVLRAEQITARYQVETGRWVRIAKRFTFGATYAMNTWQSWTTHDVAGVVLHSVPPLAVFCAAEAVTELRDRLTEAVSRAHLAAVERRRHEIELDSIGRPDQPAGSTPAPEPDRPAVDPIDSAPDGSTGDASVGSAAVAGSGPAGPVTDPSWSGADQGVSRSRRVRPDRGRRVPRSARNTAPRRSIEEARADALARVESGEIDPTTVSAEELRRVLRIGPDRARLIRDELRAGPAGPVEPDRVDPIDPAGDEGDDTDGREAA